MDGEEALIKETENGQAERDSERVQGDPEG